MVKSLQKWLEKSGYNPEKIKLFGGGEALEVSTPYQGQTPTAEQFATLAEIRQHVSRHYAGIDRKSTRLNSSHPSRSRMPSSA